MWSQWVDDQRASPFPATVVTFSFTCRRPPKRESAQAVRRCLGSVVGCPIERINLGRKPWSRQGPGESVMGRTPVGRLRKDQRPFIAQPEQIWTFERNRI